MEHRRELVGSVQKLDGGQKHRYGVSWLVLYLVSERRSKWTVLAWLLLAVRHARGTSVLVPFTWKVKMLGGLRKGAGEEKAPYDGQGQCSIMFNDASFLEQLHTRHLRRNPVCSCDSN